MGKATADKVKKLAEENNIQITTTLPPVMHRSSHDIFEFRTVTSSEVRKIIVDSPELEAMDNKQLSIVIFLDMSKAFDSVRHDMLLQRISNLGASPAVYTWFKSYLSDRWQYVRIGTTALAPATLSYGIPQGSVLSAFLFNMYTDSLPSIPESCNLESYVDDSKTFLSFTLSNMIYSLRQVEEDLHRVFEWCCRNSLLVNPEKTKMLLVGTRQLMNQLEAPIHINFMGETLTPVTEVKDLGMFLDSHLTYDKHIGRLKHNFDEQTLATIIDTLVMSKINYCSSVWANTSDNNIKKIQLIKNYAARLIAGVSKYDHISPTLSTLGWLTIKEHLVYRDALLTFKSINNIAPPYLCDKCEERNRTIIVILEEKETWIFQNAKHRVVRDHSNIEEQRYGMALMQI